MNATVTDVMAPAIFIKSVNVLTIKHINVVRIMTDERIVILMSIRLIFYPLDSFSEWLLYKPKHSKFSMILKAANI